VINIPSVKIKNSTFPKKIIVKKKKTRKTEKHITKNKNNK
jgi:hypothetical protein